MKLKNLQISDCFKLSSLEGIGNLTKLTSLTLTEVPDHLDLAPLNDLPSLEKLDLRLESVQMAYKNLTIFNELIPPEGHDEGFEVLCNSPSLRFINMDMYEHRSAEIEADLATTRGDSHHVRSRADEWTKLLARAPDPQRTVPRILRAMVETAQNPTDWKRIEELVAFLHKWGTSWEAAQEILEEHGLPIR